MEDPYAFSDEIEDAAGRMLDDRWLVTCVYADGVFRTFFTLFADPRYENIAFDCYRDTREADAGTPEGFAARLVPGVLRQAWRKAVLPDQDWRPAGTVPEDYYAM